MIREHHYHYHSVFIIILTIIILISHDVILADEEENSLNFRPENRRGLLFPSETCYADYTATTPSPTSRQPVTPDQLHWVKRGEADDAENDRSIRETDDPTLTLNDEQPMSDQAYEPDNNPDEDFEIPAYKLTYTVTYNVDLDTTNDHTGVAPESGVVSEKCGQFYARNFLENFVNLKDWLDRQCASIVTSNVSADSAESGDSDYQQSPAVVHVYPYAVVHIIRNQVRIETFLNASLRHNNVGDKDDIRSCIDSIKGSLKSVDEINEALQESRSRRGTDSMEQGSIMGIRDIEGQGGCEPARLGPNKLELNESVWVCKDDQRLDEDGRRCKPKPTPTPRNFLHDVTSTFTPPHNPFSKKPTTGSRVTLAPLTQPSSQPTEEPTTVKPEVKIKPWDIELMKNISRIELREGGPSYELILRVWFNQSAICSESSAENCDVTLNVGVETAEDKQDPVCRKTGESIAQVVISKPVVIPDQKNIPGTRSVRRRYADRSHWGLRNQELDLDPKVDQEQFVQDNDKENYCATVLRGQKVASSMSTFSKVSAQQLTNETEFHSSTTSSSSLSSSSAVSSTTTTTVLPLATENSTISSFIVKLYIKAVLDQKYDKRQIRNLTISLQRTNQLLDTFNDTNITVINRRATADKNVSDTYRKFIGLHVDEEQTNREQPVSEMLVQIPIYIDDGDRKATCQSINDPHVTTFDGLEYNNFFEGEFFMYRHKTLPFAVQTIYQKCHPLIPASCNCAVAVQSGNDVIVIDRCYRNEPDVTLPSIVSRRISFQMINESTKSLNMSAEDLPITPPPLIVQMYLNGTLTPGTRIFRDEVGKKYFIFLPHGALVKVMISNTLVNFWIVPSPQDLYHTEGLCGSYDTIRSNDFHMRDGSPSGDQDTNKDSSMRPEPERFIQDWRVDIEAGESIFSGVTKMTKRYDSVKYCECETSTDEFDNLSVKSKCDVTADVSNCDVLEGVEITETLVERALAPIANSSSGDLSDGFSGGPHTRSKRGVTTNKVMTGVSDQPIIMDKQFKSPKYSWKAAWNKAIAKDYCRQYIKDNYTIGKLCSSIQSVNFKQEITTCMEDIKITGGPIWADSARDAMKEQCIEELQKNGSLPDDIVKKIRDNLCPGDCSKHGVCTKGVCQCDEGYRGSLDCSVKESAAPSTYELPRYGLCDVRYMNCSRVIVYGDRFINSPNLSCHLTEVKVSEKSFMPVIPENDTLNNRSFQSTKKPAVFLNFNAVECPIPNTRNSYLVSISNNGLNASEPLLFIPFDSACSTCNSNNVTCIKLQNSCIIDGRCYKEGEKSAKDHCLVCKAIDDEFEWTTVADPECRPDWWEGVYLPEWVVAVAAAIGGSLIGVAMGFLLYQCFCNSKKFDDDDIPDRPRRRVSGEEPSSREYSSYSGVNSHPASTCDASLLHRSRAPPSLSYDPFGDLALPQSDAPPIADDLTALYSEGRGVETGVDSNTYF